MWTEKDGSKLFSPGISFTTQNGKLMLMADSVPISGDTEVNTATSGPIGRTPPYQYFTRSATQHFPGNVGVAQIGATTELRGAPGKGAGYTIEYSTTQESGVAPEHRTVTYHVSGTIVPLKWPAGAK